MNLPKMQCARAIPVTWLGSGSCQAWPSRMNTNEWRTDIYIIYIYIYIQRRTRFCHTRHTTEDTDVDTGHTCTTLYVHLTFCWPYMSVYLSQFLTNLMNKMLFYNKFISCFYMFRAHVFIVMSSKLHYTASGIITLKQVIGLKLLKYNSTNMSK